MSSESEDRISRERAVYFRNKLRAARDAALRDSEGYQQVLFAVEQLGQQYWGKDNKGKLTKNTLAKLKPHFVEFVKLLDPFEGRPEWDECFGKRYEMVKQGRDDAMHVGAIARSLTDCCVRLSITLEDALMSNIGERRIRDCMVREPVRTFGWQRIALIRQTMLESSFSHLPFRKDGEWHIVSADAICQYLLAAKDSDERKSRLAKTLKEAEQDSLHTTMQECDVGPNEKVQSVLGKIRGDKPVLVTRKEIDGGVHQNELVGILNAFDVM